MEYIIITIMAGTGAAPPYAVSVAPALCQVVLFFSGSYNLIQNEVIAVPGRPIAMMLFKTWGYTTMAQAIMFMSYFKLAHYMKIAHLPMFFCQVVAATIAGTVQLGVQSWMFSNIEGLCDANQKDGFICPETIVFGNASVLTAGILQCNPIQLPTTDQSDFAK